MVRSLKLVRIKEYLFKLSLDALNLGVSLNKDLIIFVKPFKNSNYVSITGIFISLSIQCCETISMIPLETG